MRHTALNVVDAARKEPGTLVLLAGVDDQMFERLIYYRPFGAYGMWDVYLTLETRANIHMQIEPDGWTSFLPDPELLQQARAQNKLQVLDIGGDSIRDISAEYERQHPSSASVLHHPFPTESSR